MQDLIAGSQGEENTMMKHIRIAFVFLFTLSLFLCVVPAATAASNSGTCGDNLTWSLSGSGRLTISGTGAMTDNTHPWLGRTVYSVVIGNGVTHIGKYAFDNMSELTSVTIPNSIRTVSPARTPHRSLQPDQRCIRQATAPSSTAIRSHG